MLNTGMVNHTVIGCNEIVSSIITCLHPEHIMTNNLNGIINRSHLILIVSLGIGMSVGAFGIWMAPVQIGALMDSLGYSASQSGLLGSIEIFAMSFTAILISPLIAMWPCSRMAIFGSVFAAIFQLLSAIADTFILLTIFRLLTGIGCGVIFGAVCAAASMTNNPDSDFAWAQAIMNVFFLILFILAPYILLYGQYQGLFISYAIVMLIVIPLLRLITVENASILKMDRVAIVPSKRRYLIILNMLAAILFSMGVGALWGYVERMGVKNVGLSMSEVGALLSVSVLFMLAGSVIAGVVGTRFGRTIPLATASMVCGISALITACANSIYTYAAGLMLYSVAYLFITPYIIAGTSSELDPTGKLASAMGGILFLFFSLGIGFGGFIVDYFSLSGVGWFGLITCFTATLLFIFLGLIVSRQNI